MLKHLRLSIELEVVQIGPVPCSTMSVSTAVAKALLGRLDGGKTVWAAGLQSGHETAYAIREVRFGEDHSYVMRAGDLSVVFRPAPAKESTNAPA